MRDRPLEESRHPAPGPGHAVGRDLVANRPGEQVRRQAEELRRAAPVRSLLCRLLAIPTEEGAFRLGAAGEAIVGRRLDRLDPAWWRVLHSVPVGAGHADIDHLVIGPPGVFTLNTKHHPAARVRVDASTFLVDGRRRDYLTVARHEGRRASRLLGAACGVPVGVRPVIVVIARTLRVDGPPGGVAVVKDETVVAWLKSQPAAMGPGSVEALFGWARRSATWSGRAGQSDG